MKEKVIETVETLREFLPAINGKITLAAGSTGAVLSSLFGGWDSALTTLCIFMVIDYLSGLAVAGIFKKSHKTAGGGLSSRAGFQGLIRKGIILAVVLISYRLDLMIGSTWIKDCVIVAFAANELLSIVENCGLMGIPIPLPIQKGIEILCSKSNNRESDGGKE